MNILVIGGSRGIGRAIAAELAANGDRVLITGRDLKHLQSTGDELGDQISTFRMDLTSAQDVSALVDHVEKEFAIDGVVLSAARFPDPATARSVVDADTEELEGILETNVVSYYRLMRQLIPHLKTRKHPRVVIIGSTAGVRQDKGGVYGISKAALNNYATNLRQELIKDQIGVSLINPGGTFTETRVKQGEEDDRLLESRDLGILVNALFRMSHQAVLERVDIRPLIGDTY